VSRQETNGGAHESPAERLRRLAGEPNGNGPTEPREHMNSFGAAAASNGQAGEIRRLPDERGDELPRGVGDLADPVEVRSHSPRFGAAMLNVPEGRLFGPDGAISRVYHGHETIRAYAWRLMHVRRLGEFLQKVAAAEFEIEREEAKGEAAGLKARRLDRDIADVKQQITDYQTQAAQAEESLEDAYDKLARVRDEELGLDRREAGAEPQGTPVVVDGEPAVGQGCDSGIPPMPGSPLERVAIALADKAMVVFGIELVVLTFVLGTLLSGVIPSHIPYSLDVYGACAGVASGLLVTGAVFGWGLAGTAVSRRVGAGVFMVAAVAVLTFGIERLKIAYGASLPGPAREVFVVSSFGAVLLAAFVSYVDLVYRAHARVRRFVIAKDPLGGEDPADPPRHGTRLTDAEAKIQRRREKLVEILGLLHGAQGRLAELTAEQDQLLVVFEETRMRMLARQAQRERDDLQAVTIEAECAAGVQQEGGHRQANIAGAQLGHLKAIAENSALSDEPQPAAVEVTDPSGTQGPDEAGADPLGALAGVGAGLLAIAAVVSALTHFVWVLVGATTLVLGIALLLLERMARRRATRSTLRDSGGDPGPEIKPGQFAPAAGLRRWVWHPDQLVPGYQRGYGPDSKHD
jgi:hypothetical protein